MPREEDEQFLGLVLTIVDDVGYRVYYGLAFC